MTGHKYAKGQLVTVKSGRTYRISPIEGGPVLDRTGKPYTEPCYGGVQDRNGKPYGPYRLFPESSLTPIKGD